MSSNKFLTPSVRAVFLLLVSMVWLCGAPRHAFAGGPRFVTGYGLAVQPGQAEGWATAQLAYFTDPGNLAATVSHVQADAMVAAAAAVWNVPTSTLTLMQGGQLAEHVSGANSYFNGSNFVFPSDVQASNEGNIPVAVLYDTDGSLTDLLLGSGASQPIGCRQNAVTQSVDDLQADGHIHHALVVLNGRCVGSAPEQLMQMQYQLARAFGRVLGLAWSQTNDNVFTGSSPITADQVAYWPLMHPLDVLCGPYSYQCMTDPFTLRADDLSGLAALYTVLGGNVPVGKQASDTGGAFLFIVSQFPTGQGMDWVNFAASRQHYGAQEHYQVVSGVSGLFYQQALASPVTRASTANQGTANPPFEGIAALRAVPVEGLSDVSLVSEPINPLYSGEYAIGPYVRPPVAPSGSTQSFTYYSQYSVLDIALGSNATAWDAASTCNPGNDGSENAPATLDPSGWQPGQLCGWGHNSWWSAAVRAGRSWTLEVTATDERGVASISKAQTVMGIWNAADPVGTLPTLGGQAVPFNSMAFGITQIKMPVTTKDTPVRFVIGDAYGAGRPDFTYTTRLLYADSITPVTVGADGGTITIVGTGFRQGNVVRINGVPAAVQSWSATRIVAIAPSAAVAQTRPGVAVTVSVSDTTTTGTAEITRALTYTRALDLLQLVSAPPALEAGVTATVPFSVRVMASDGMTPIAGAAVQFTVSSGVAAFGLCGAASTCLAFADDNGIVQTPVSAGALGSVTLTASYPRAAAPLQITLPATDPIRTAAMVTDDAYVAAGASGTWTVELSAYQDGVLTTAVPTGWSAVPGLNLLSATSITAADGLGQAIVRVNQIASGSVETLSGCAWVTVCATWTVRGIDPSAWQISEVAGAGQSIAATSTLGAVTLLVTDLAGHPLQGAPVSVQQRVLGWEGLCATPGRCPSAPVLASAETAGVSGADGKLMLQPLQLPGIAQTVEIAVITGTHGFLSMTLVKTPSPE